MFYWVFRQLTNQWINVFPRSVSCAGCLRYLHHRSHPPLQLHQGQKTRPLQDVLRAWTSRLALVDTLGCSLGQEVALVVESESSSVLLLPFLPPSPPSLPCMHVSGPQPVSFVQLVLYPIALSLLHSFLLPLWLVPSSSLPLFSFDHVLQLARRIHLQTKLRAGHLQGVAYWINFFLSRCSFLSRVTVFVTFVCIHFGGPDGISVMR